MSWRVRALVLLFVVIWGWLQTPHMTHIWHQWLTSVGAARNVTAAVPSTAYLLKDGQWLEFNIPTGATALRILTNAAVTDPNSEPERSLERDRIGWRYAVDYQLCDNSTQPVESRTYHLRASLQQYEDPESGRYYGMTWFQGSNQLSARTCTISLPLNKQSNRPQRLRVRLSPAKGDVAQVVVRVYMRTERPQYNHPYTWARLSEKQRERLCRASVYPPDLISQRERRNLLRWNWSALPPRGRADLDFEQRRIYQQETVPTSTDRIDAFSDGLEVHPDQLVTFRLPSRAATVQLEASWLASASIAADTIRSPQPLTVRWYPADWSQPTQVWQGSPDSASDLQMTVNGGVLELESKDPIAVHPVWSANDEQNDSAPPVPEWSADELGRFVMTPTTRSLRAYTVDQAGSLRYTIQSILHEPTPCRITLRKLVPIASSSTASVGPSNVTCEWRDAKDQPLRQFTLSLPDVISRYDRAEFRKLPSRVSESIDYYFSIPPDVHAIVLLDPSNTMAASVATRPEELPRSVSLSAALMGESGEAMNEPSIPTWFLLQPDEYSRRINEGFCANLRMAVRPNAAEIPGGNTEGVRWEEEQPTGQWLGRHLLTPRSLAAASAPSNWNVIYCPIPVGKEVAAEWHAGDTTLIAPRLVYDGITNRDQPIQVWVDDQLHHEFLPRASRGEVQLPEIFIDQKITKSTKLRVQADREARLYVSNVQIADAPLYVKRMAIQLEKAPIEFELEKKTPSVESWSLRAFATTTHATVGGEHSDAAEPIELEATIHGIDERTEGPYEGWTFRTRWLRIRPEDRDSALCLEGSSAFTDAGQLANIQLGSDLPPGRYRVTVQLREATHRTVYISLNRPIPLLAPPAEPTNSETSTAETAVGESEEEP